MQASRQWAAVVVGLVVLGGAGWHAAAADDSAPVVIAQQAAPPAAGAPPPGAPTTPPGRPAERPLGAAGPSGVRPTPQQTSPDFLPILDRWRIGFPEWPRYELPLKDVPYVRGRWWDPYNLNVLKGDYPILGQDYFLVVTAVSDSLAEFRRIPLPSGPSQARPGSFEFFGEGDQIFLNQNWILSLELFKGDTAFRPRDWEIRITPVANINYVDARERGALFADVRRGTTRYDDHVTLQEILAEYHLADVSPYYDFIAVRGGIQPFTTDFRGFLFSDNQLGARFFGNLGSNRYQYNVAYFRPLEKDTNSGLNRIFKTRGQHLGVANFFWQDFAVLGYTVMANFHYLHDSGERHFDRNGFLVRPAAVGTFQPKTVNAYWLGFHGDGHIGRLNLTHAFYQVLGEETHNQIAGRRQDISAQMAAIEASVDLDWLRPRFSAFWASGDRNPADGTARGFDMIFDNPNFAGGGFSYWVRQGLPLTQTGVELVGRQSLIPNLRSNKLEGQPNFVNPGVFLVGVGLDAAVTPKLTTFFNANYLRFHHTQVLQRLLFQPRISPDIGIDYSLGFRWRPFLIENVVVTGGASVLQALQGMRDVYTEDTFRFTSAGLERRRRDFPYDPLYSIFLGLALIF